MPPLFLKLWQLLCEAKMVGVYPAIVAYTEDGTLFRIDDAYVEGSMICLDLATIGEFEPNSRKVA